MISRVKNLGLNAIVLGGALGLSSCNFLDPNDYPGHEQEIAAYNRSIAFGGAIFGAVPYANNIQQAALLNAAGHAAQTSNILMGQNIAGAQRLPKGQICTYVSWDDKNHNNKWSPDEMSGVSDRFWAGQNFTVTAILSTDLPEWGYWFVAIDIGNFCSGLSLYTDIFVG